MKIEELKHNHSLTDLLKILLFAILMLAPALSVTSRCLYVIANKNAYQSYSDYTETKTTNVDLSTSLIEGQTYTFNFLSYENTINEVSYGIYNHQTNVVEKYFPNENWQAVSFAVNTSAQRTRLIVYDTNNTQHNLFDAVGSFYFVSNGVNTTTQQNVWYTITTLSYTTGKLDNVFEYSVSKLATDQMFTWTQNTPVFTGVQAMCTQLGITAPAISIIIAYWLILTCVYIVIDIVIKLITYITHLIGARKGA